MITADDFGMCPPVNRGTIEVLKGGKVKNVEIISVSPYSEEAIQYCLKHPEIQVGCHVVLTDEFNIGFRIVPVKEQIELLTSRGLKVWRTTSHMFQCESNRKIEDYTWESYQIRPEAKKEYYDMVQRFEPEKEIIIHCADEGMKEYSPWWQSYLEDVKYFK